MIEPIVLEKLQSYCNLNLLQLLYDKGFRFKLSITNNRVDNNLAEEKFNKGIISYCEDYIPYSVVIEWLRVNHKLHLLLDYSHDHNKYSCKVFDQFHADELRRRNPRSEGRFPYPYQSNCLRHYYRYDTPQAAYSAAFDYILNNLI